MGMYQGVNASEGIGIGTVMVAVDPDLTFEPHEVADTAAEKERYQTALSVFCEKTQAQADHMKETVGEAEAEIMSGHIVLAQDPGMTDGINSAIDAGTILAGMVSGLASTGLHQAFKQLVGDN